MSCRVWLKTAIAVKLAKSHHSNQAPLEVNQINPFYTHFSIDDTQKSRKSAQLSRLLTADTTHVPTTVTDLLEYEWPPNQPQNDFYFIQEQLAELLSIKSFKRKYPNIRRRPIEGDEKKHLIEKHRLSDVIPPHLLNDLTALLSDDVHDLMKKEYSEIYEVN